MTLVGRELKWGPGAEPPEVQGFWAINNCQMSMLLYPSCDTGRSRIGVGSRGEEPPEVQGFGAINNCQMSMLLYLSCDTGRSRFVVGSGGEAPRSSGVLYVKLSSDEHILNLICDTGRSRISLGSRGRNPRKFRGFGQ